MSFDPTYPHGLSPAIIKEVLRYREAMDWGFENAEKYALSSGLITGIQSRLMPDGNGQYRREQNEIANLASRESLYTPPIASDIPNLIGNWENYANMLDESLDPLIRVIISHCQFEAIHLRTKRVFILS